MTNPPFPEATLVLFTDCPLCDEPAPLDLESGFLDCAACAAYLELAADEPVRGKLAEAA